jgi:hypothetical protein
MVEGPSWKSSRLIKRKLFFAFAALLEILRTWRVAFNAGRPC